MSSMKEILVDGKMKIGELVHVFHELFPFLALEIYQNGEPVSLDYRHYSLNYVSAIKEGKPLVITPKLSVVELEELFWNNLGIQISIFRRVGNSLLQTSFTSQWTLEHQNSRGNSIFTEFKSYD